MLWCVMIKLMLIGPGIFNGTQLSAFSNSNFVGVAESGVRFVLPLGINAVVVAGSEGMLFRRVAEAC